MKKVFLYVRVSTQEQASEGYSIDEQIDRLNTYCKAMDWTVIKSYVDAGYSGATIERPALIEMVEDIKKTDAVLVYKLDRLSRSQKDTLYLIEDVFLKNNVDFISMTENFDTSSPFGRAMIGILSVFAQLEREQIKERMSMGRIGRAKEGKFHGGGWIPVGYDYIDGELKINEYEAMQVKEIHKLYQSGYSINAISNLFNDRGYSHKHGNWSASRVKYILKNDLYIGKIHYTGQTFDGEHPAIINQETYNRSMELYKSKDYSGYRHQSRTSYLGGLIWCKRCGARYGAHSKIQKKYNRRYEFYSCYSRKKSARSMIKDPNCKNKTYQRHILDEMVFGEIRKLAMDPEGLKQEKINNTEKIEIIQKEIEKIDSQKSRFMDLYGLGTFSLDEVQGKIVPLNERRQKLTSELKTLESQNGEAYRMIDSFAELLKVSDDDTIRDILKALINRIEIDGEDIDIYWNFT